MGLGDLRAIISGGELATDALGYARFLCKSGAVTYRFHQAVLRA